MVKRQVIYENYKNPNYKIQISNKTQNPKPKQLSALSFWISFGI